MTEHCRHILNLHTHLQGSGGEGVTGKMRMQPCAYAKCLLYNLQRLVVLHIADLRSLHAVSLQHFHRLRQQVTDIGDTSLHTLAPVGPHAINISVVGNIEDLGVGITQTRVHLENEQVASHCHLRTRHRLQALNSLYLLFGKIFHVVVDAFAKLALQTIVRVGIYNAELHSPGDERAQSTVVIIDSRVADSRSFAPCLYISIGLCFSALVQPRVPLVEVLYGQVVPRSQLTVLAHPSNQDSISPASALTNLQQRHLLRHPFNHGILIVILHRSSPVHLLPYLSHVDWLSLLNPSVHRNLYVAHDYLQPLLEHISISTVDDMAVTQLSARHLDAGVNIIRFSFVSNPDLHGTLLPRLSPSSVVIYYCNYHCLNS